MKDWKCTIPECENIVDPGLKFLKLENPQFEWWFCSKECVINFLQRKWKVRQPIGGNAVTTFED